MYLEAKETARLYTLLSDKLGNNTTEAMFKYIDSKTERAVDNTIQSLATKEDITAVRKEMAEYHVTNMKWMFIFWAGQIVATIGILILFFKK
jgi:hypothetical protein